MYFYKKKSLFITIIIIIIFLFLVINKGKAITEVEDSKDYELYIVYFDNNSVTTKNINEYITDEIEAISLELANNYTRIIDTNWYNLNKLISFKNNMNNIEEYYKNKYEENALSEQAIMVDIEGIKIKKVIINTNDIKKYNFKYKKLNFT